MLQQQERNSRPYSSKSSSHRCIGFLCPRLCSSKHFFPHSSSSFSHQATHRRRLEIQSRPEKGNNKYFPELFAIEIHWSITAVENNFSNCELSRFSATNQHMAQKQDREKFRQDWGEVEILTWGEQDSVGWKKTFSAEDIDLFIENWSSQAQSRLIWVGTGLVFLNGFKRLQRQRWAETRSEPARLEFGLASPQGSCLRRENITLT